MTIIPIENPREDVGREKSLWDVFQKSVGLVGKPLDYGPPVLLAVLAIPVSLFAEHRLHSLAEVSDQQKMLVSWSALTVNFSIAILGFLIAGFSIFATLSDKELFRRLASYRRQDRSVSQFKFIFFNFMYVFVIYLVTVVTSAFLTVLAESGSPADYLIRIVARNHLAEARVASCVTICLYLALVLHALLILRGFIWNIYASLVLAIFWQPAEPG